MFKATAILFALVTLILVTTSNAQEQAPELDGEWRSAYSDQSIPMDALGDFDEVAGRLGQLLARLEASGKLADSSKQEINAWFENIEEEYMDRWFGDEGKFTIRFSTNPNSTPRYDREFREHTRSATTSKVQDSKLQKHDRVLLKENTGQDHDIVWTVEMADKNHQLADMGDERNETIVALVDLMNEQAGTKAVAAGRHSMKLTVSPGSINGVATWFYSVEVGGQSSKWHHNGVFTDEMMGKVREMKRADGERESLKVELVQIYDQAGIAHYNPRERMGYHTRHDCLEYGCEKWAEGQRFPPPSMRVLFDYPEA